MAVGIAIEAALQASYEPEAINDTSEIYDRKNH